MKKLLIIGAGQYDMVAKEIAESMNCFERIGFVDDASDIAVGKLCDIEKLIREYDSAVVAIGNSELRLNLIKGYVKSVMKCRLLFIRMRMSALQQKLVWGAS